MGYERVKYGEGGGIHKICGHWTEILEEDECRVKDLIIILSLYDKMVHKEYVKRGRSKFFPKLVHMVCDCPIYL